MKIAHAFGAYFLEVRRGVDGGDRGPGAGLQVGNVLDLGQAVGAGAEAAEVTADQRGPGVGHGHVLGADPAGDVLGDGQALEGHPSGEEDVDDHQGLVRGAWMKMLSGVTFGPW